MDGWMTCSFTFFSTEFTRIRVRECNNERLCAMDPRLRLKSYPPLVSFELWTKPALNPLSYLQAFFSLQVKWLAIQFGAQSMVRIQLVLQVIYISCIQHILFLKQ